MFERTPRVRKRVPGARVLKTFGLEVYCSKICHCRAAKPNCQFQTFSHLAFWQKKSHFYSRHSAPSQHFSQEEFGNVGE
jgi:hypothetical protein